MMDDLRGNILYHHGILGMKWGIRRTPEQLGHKKSGQKSSDSNDGEEKKQADKQKIINSGNVKAAYAHRSEFSNSELQQVIDRFNMETKVKELATKDIKTGKQRMQKMNDVLSATVKMTSSGIVLYNNTAKTLNSVAGTSLPMINNGNTEQRRQNNGGH